jgi:signal transduction histidine kinase/CheY-like chemotaxis protein
MQQTHAAASAAAALNQKSKRRVRGKLLRATLGVFLLTAVATLSVVVWLLQSTEQQRLAEMERQVTAQIASKARMLVDNHALALTGHVADAAVSDIQALVQRAVEQDEDLVYGLFLGRDDKPWAYASSGTRGERLSPEAVLSHSREVFVPDGGWSSPVSRQRRTHLFAQEVFEVSRPVVDDGQMLGTIVYGFSVAPLARALAGVRLESESTRRRMLLWVSLGVAVSTLLGAATMARMARRITDPLGELTRAANAITAGELDVRVKVSSEDELEVLAAAFNQMLLANEESVRRAQGARDAALEASRLKSEFLANMSHEIRTPMNGVIGMLELMLKMPLDAKMRRYAEAADSSASALMVIINDVLDFSKMEAGKYELSSLRYDPELVLREVADLGASRAHQKGVELVCHRTDQVPEWVVGDPDRYRQVLNNLVGNAVKFTARGEVYVELSFEREPNGARLLKTIVQDTGIGIAPEHHPKLFETFSQVDGSMVRTYGGTGLGLAISRRLVEMMGGQIGVVSERGVGSTFWFTIPVSAAGERAIEPVIRAMAGKHAMIVEANPRWCRVIAEHLSAWGLTSRAFADADSAILAWDDRRTSGGRFDLAIIAAPLTDMSVGTFVARLRKRASRTELSLIVLTQLGRAGALAGIENEPMVQLAKPIRPRELREALEAPHSEGAGYSPMRMWSESSRRSLSSQLSASGRAILIVDDNEINRFVAAEHVARAGYATVTANDGAQAVELVKSQRFAAILMDCQMPLLDGYSAVQQIRLWEAGRSRVPIIALTAHALPDEKEKVLAAGMDDYLSKPLRPQSLERLLERYVRGNRPTLAPFVLSLTPPNETPELDPGVPRSEKLIRLFLDRMPAQLDALDRTLDAADREVLKQVAHTMKGGCLSLGALRMAEVAASIEDGAVAGDLVALRTQAAAARQHYQAVAALLSGERPRSRPPRRSVPAA